MTTIPASRVAAQDQGAALAHATHSTQVPAAQKRGGGLAHRIQLIAIAQGRQPMPEGGAIESHCCAAAGIFQPKPKARAGVAYPTTSVRQGAKDAATLRSPTAPHAQPVEGYKHLLIKTVQQNPSRLYDVLALNLKGRKRTRADARYQLIQVMPLRHQGTPKIKNSLCNFGRRRIKHIKSEEKVGLPVNHSLHLHPPRSYIIDGVELINEFAPRAQDSDSDLFKENPNFFFAYLLSLLGPIVRKPSHRNGRKDRSNRTNSLYPCRGVGAVPRPATYPPPEQHYSRRKQCPRQQAARAKSNRESIRQHCHPLAINEAGSMPLAAVTVQGVAA